MLKNKKILLITPPYHCGVVESAGRWPNLGLLYIAGELRKTGFEPVYYDAMAKFHTMEEVVRTIKDTQPGAVVITAITATINTALEVLKHVKKIGPDIITVLGGIHPTFCSEQILQENTDIVDFCCIGEGEHTLQELLLTVDALRCDYDKNLLQAVRGIAFMYNGQAVKTASRPFIEDLDTLSPAWDIVNWKDYPLYFIDNSIVAIVSSSRGCTNHCAFCSQHKFWNSTYRERDPWKFADEMELLAAEYGINVFFIADEYPTRSRERWEKILDILIEKNLGVHILLETCVADIIRDADILWKYRKAGIMFVYLGVESTKDSRLEMFKKDIKFEQSRDAIKLLKTAGMITESSLIIGMPDETPGTIAETLELAFLYGTDYMHFLFITPWPYADMYEQLKTFIEETDFSKYNLVEPIIRSNYMTRKELMQSVLNCYKEYYSRRIPEWHAMRGDEFKKQCLLKGMKAIMENSFLKKHMHEVKSFKSGVPGPELPVSGH
ncbi:MAG: cobalamin B12-binding domain-containing protein [Planctomycetes bacterium]|nr:cobalamin B12-binding domain-containing protein [Planctomycetota bacterium]